MNNPVENMLGALAPWMIGIGFIIFIVLSIARNIKSEKEKENIIDKTLSIGGIILVLYLVIVAITMIIYA